MAKNPVVLTRIYPNEPMVVDRVRLDFVDVLEIWERPDRDYQWERLSSTVRQLQLAIPRRTKGRCAIEKLSDRAVGHLVAYSFRKTFQDVR
jgi:hypothetical protein